MVHAPRQTGKTTTLMALADRLTAEGRYAALHVSCEAASVFPDDVGEVVRGTWASIERAARHALPEPLRPPAAVETETAAFWRRSSIAGRRAALGPSCSSSTRSTL